MPNSRGPSPVTSFGRVGVSSAGAAEGPVQPTCPGTSTGVGRALAGWPGMPAGC
jgi:hypothetical protein